MKIIVPQPIFLTETVVFLIRWGSIHKKVVLLQQDSMHMRYATSCRCCPLSLSASA
jgi:hypothetical protein